jgi:hypothetical protein
MYTWLVVLGYGDRAACAVFAISGMPECCTAAMLDPGISKGVGLQRIGLQKLMQPCALLQEAKRLHHTFRFALQCCMMQWTAQ